MSLRGPVELMWRVKTGADELNDPVYEWQAQCKVLAAKTDVKDAEKQDAGREVSEHVTRFVVRSVSMRRLNVSSADRLRGFGADWDVLGVKDAPRFGRNAFEVTAKKITAKTVS